MRRPALSIVLLLVLNVADHGAAQANTPRAFKAVLRGSFAFVEDHAYGLGVARGTGQGLGRRSCSAFSSPNRTWSPSSLTSSLSRPTATGSSAPTKEAAPLSRDPRRRCSRRTFQITGGTGRFDRPLASSKEGSI